MTTFDDLSLGATFRWPLISGDTRLMEKTADNACKEYGQFRTERVWPPNVPVIPVDVARTFGGRRLDR